MLRKEIVNKGYINIDDISCLDEIFVKENIGEIDNSVYLKFQEKKKSNTPKEWRKNEISQLITDAIISKTKQNEIEEELKIYRNILNKKTYSYLESILNLQTSPLQIEESLTKKEIKSIKEFKIYNTIVDYFMTDGILKLIRTDILPNYQVNIERESSSFILYSDQKEYKKPKMKIITYNQNYWNKEIILDQNIYPNKNLSNCIKKEVDIQKDCINIIEDYLGINDQTIKQFKYNEILTTNDLTEKRLTKQYKKEVINNTYLLKNKNYY